MPDYDGRESDLTTEPAEAPARSETAKSMSLLDILIVLAAHKGFIAKFTLAWAVAAVVVSLLLPSVFTAKTTILPPQQAQSIGASFIGQLGMLASLAGKDIGLKNPSDVYVAMLRSDSVQDELVRRFDLQSLYKAKRFSDARNALDHVSQIESTKSGLISISVKDRSPQRAATLANAYVEELQKLNGRLAITEASQRRLFFEQQMRKAKDDLTNAEIAMKQTQEKTGVMQIDAQSRSIVAAVTQLKAQIAATEVQLQAMKLFATDQNPDVKLATQQLAGLQQQLAKLLRNSNVAEGDVEIPTTKVPEAGLEYIRRYRDVKYYETIYELIGKQYEVARLDEAKSAPVIQVVDLAAPPDRRSWPFRSLIVILATTAAFFLSVMLVLVWDSLKAANENPQQHEKFRMLKFYCSLK